MAFLLNSLKIPLEQMMMMLYFWSINETQTQQRE